MGKNIIILLWNKLYAMLFRKKIKQISANVIYFNEIVNSGILYVNLILLYRLITFRFWDYFVYFSKAPQNFEDCSLKEANSFLKDYDINLMIICLVNLMLLFGVILYSMKKKVKIIFWEEEINFPIKMFYFFFLFQFSDQGLQIYKEFIQFK